MNISIQGCKSSLCKSYQRGTLIVRRNLADSKQPFEIRKALLVSKLTRLEYEKYRYPHLNEISLEKEIRDRGTHYESLAHYHELHKNFESKVAKSFKDFGVDVDIVNRGSINKEKVKWADILVPIGGDGTFLMAALRASRYFSNGIYNMPIIGFNSDPFRSEGRLMIPQEYSVDVKGAVKRIIKNDFKWMRRSRIRVSLLGFTTNFSRPVDLHETIARSMPNGHMKPEFLNESQQQKYQASVKSTIPFLALNEVFIGETLSARVSSLKMRINDSDKETKIKCSGLCVSTGTGSTSWLSSINRLSVKTVDELVKLFEEEGFTFNNINTTAITEKYNKNLVFAPDDPRLYYAIRELICASVWPSPKGIQHRRFANSLFVTSSCIDASLVIDGSIAYPFNDGTKALLEVRPEDALLTISME